MKRFTAQLHCLSSQHALFFIMDYISWRFPNKHENNGSTLIMAYYKEQRQCSKTQGFKKINLFPLDVRESNITDNIKYSYFSPETSTSEQRVGEMINEESLGRETQRWG